MFGNSTCQFNHRPSGVSAVNRLITPAPFGVRFFYESGIVFLRVTWMDVDKTSCDVHGKVIINTYNRPAAMTTESNAIETGGCLGNHKEVGDDVRTSGEDRETSDEITSAKAPL